MMELWPEMRRLACMACFNWLLYCHSSSALALALCMAATNAMICLCDASLGCTQPSKARRSEMIPILCAGGVVALSSTSQSEAVKKFAGHNIVCVGFSPIAPAAAATLAATRDATTPVKSTLSGSENAEAAMASLMLEASS